MGLKRRLFQLGYGGLFVVVLPALLAAWAWRLDRLALVAWPVPLPAAAGWLLVAAGVGLMAWAMRDLWVIGRGLPMNAFPPPRLVTASSYGWVSHPIYVGFVVGVAGTAIAVASPAGFWVVAPITALAAAALVLGYEGPRLRERFGDRLRTLGPRFGLPADAAPPAPLPVRLAAAATALLPWAAAYALLSRLPAPLDAPELRMAWEFNLPLVGWMFWPYSAAYLFAIVGPLALSSARDLRR